VKIMKIDRRKFLSLSALLGSSLIYSPGSGKVFAKKKTPGRNLVISTWKHGHPANEAAAAALEAGKSALDAVETGVRVSEADPEVTGVGYGGFPDDTGCVTLDASIMNSKGNAGAVGCLQNIKHPISVARKVMEETDHVMLVGEGALAFAKLHGFKEENLLTEKARKAYLDWKTHLSDEDDWFPPVDERNHDTIGMIAQDANGDLAGACTTSGLRWKIHGRVGDSPIIGAGMYVDNEVGGAAATGRGEAVMKIVGSFLVVEEMRRGASPQEAIGEALNRIITAATPAFRWHS
jgi:L-asparaginase/N4-(beta-N-acetylglucosaminyl)-L-asparaginase